MSRLLDSEDVLEAICNEIMYYSDCGITEGRQIAEDVVDGIRTAECKKGKWNRLAYDTFNCPNCGRTFIVVQGKSFMNFCPNCRANMREGGDDE